MTRSIGRIFKRIIYISVAISMIIATVIFILPCLPGNEEQMRRNTVMVECKTCYELTADGKTVMYTDGWNDDRTLIKTAINKDSIPYKCRYAIGQWIYRYRLLPICNGTLIAADVCSDEQNIADSINKDIRNEIDKWVADLERKRKRTERELEELDYYLKKHNVQDNGYYMMAEHAEKVKQAYHETERTEKNLKSITECSRIRIRPVTKYTLLYIGDGARNIRTECNVTERSRQQGTCIMQTTDGKTPEGAYPIYAKNWMMNSTFTAGNISVASLFNNKGRLNGHAVTNIGDSIVYSGMYAGGKKQGHAVAKNVRTGDKTVGTWNADTLTSGIRISESGTYRGMFNRDMLPEGHGTLTSTSGYYNGEWAAGKRNGFGCGTDTTGKVRAGEWIAGIYKGERMRHTSDRIYGIDISRHQHEKGKKKYPINWNAMRITHLGKISNKDICGKVDYPVSFVYIKSTEGTTVRNRYYRADYAQARKRGIKCGAYHFFSPYSNAGKQALFFIRNSRFSKGDFPPVLDVEPTENQIRKTGGTQAMFSKIRTWMTVVEKHTGMRPILYVSQQFVNKYLPSAPDIKSKYRIWIARYGEYKPDVRLVFWQLSPDGRVAGIHGDVDINVFNGYKDEYEQFCKSPAF